jgi:MYXO-CTERM domain-containing protein
VRSIAAVLVLVATARAATYDVGPGQTFANIGDVPWESLAAGDTVLIHARSTPYAEKWVINRAGTMAAPITVRGVPDPQTGALPLITGENATPRAQLNYWNEDRGLIKIGGSNTPPDGTPSWVTVESLHLERARSAYTFTGRNGVTPYAGNAAGVYVEKGTHVTIRGCEVEDNGNGLFVASASDTVTIEGNFLHGNGNVGSIYEHNTYTEAKGIVYQFNRFAALCSGCGGNALKDRSSSTIVRFNWIEGGNRPLDLVDSGDPVLLGDPGYQQTFVYGNVLLKPDDNQNSQFVHFGGDSGTTANYRGTLYFWNNTLISARQGNTTVAALSSNAQTAELRDNLVFSTGALALSDSAGTVDYSGNWLKTGFSDSFSGVTGTVHDAGGNVGGTDPGFVAAASQDYHLTAASGARNQGTALPGALGAYPLDVEYKAHQQSEPRPVDTGLDIGAFGYGTAANDLGTSAPTDGGIDGMVGAPTGKSAGCGCSAGGAGGSATFLLGVIAVALASRRRRIGTN